MNRFHAMLSMTICLVLLLSIPASATDVYEFSMLPRYFPKRIHSMIDPMVAYLSAETGAQVNLVLTNDYTDYENRLKSGEIEIGYENPIVYTKVSETHEALAMVIRGEGGDRYRGIIIARPDSGIQAFSDLKHKKIMIVGKTSAGGFLSQKLTLAENGLEVEDDCELEVAADNKQENVIISVSVGDVDAGFIRESALHVADQYIQPGTIKVVAPCAWLPNWAISVNRQLSAEMKSAIRTAVVNLDEDSPVLKALGVSGFKPATDSEYDIVRQVLSK